MESQTSPKYSDDFGENKFISRLNRRFSSLIRRFLFIPESWEDSPPNSFRRHLSSVNALAQTALLISGIAAAVVGIILALRSDSTPMFFISLGIIPGIFLVQFIIGLFCSANLQLTFGNHVTLASRLMPEFLALLGILNLLYTAVAGVLACVAGYAVSLLAGLTATFVFAAAIYVNAYLSWIAVNCEKLLDVRIDDSGKQCAAEYLFELITFLGRFFLAQVPIVFLSSVILLGAGVIGFASFEFAGALPANSLIDQVVTGTQSAPLILALSGLFPIWAHFLYLIILTIADLGTGFFRLVRSSTTVANLSEKAMAAATENPEDSK